MAVVEPFAPYTHGEVLQGFILRLLEVEEAWEVWESHSRDKYRVLIEEIRAFVRKTGWTGHSEEKVGAGARQLELPF